ncbi:hypothetical protein [Shewanella surugensis]|uniref:Uncharacterized protein n=1 Tax=Shewanella surugensis TaxID=212020 RepID=A0ABT0LJA6_9GAMM|nr:hypothetical protein [Shewanella surugensis]MCL1127784.1 hypothetical protein [Shewanella surugensis]
MRFINLLLIFFISPLIYAADGFDFEKTKTAPELRDAYINLNNRYEFCMDQRKRQLKPIKNAWLASLSKKDKGFVLMKLDDIAFNRCVKAETTIFNDTLVKYTIETQNFEAIETWVELNKPFRPEESQAALKKLDQNEIEKLSHYPQLYAPFKVMEAAKIVTK